MVENPTPKVVAAPGVDVMVQLQSLTSGFNPALLTPTQTGAAPAEFLIALHDGSAKAGVEYRYTLKYKLLNPLFDRPASKSDKPEWVQQFDLESPMSEPSIRFSPDARVTLLCRSAQQQRPVHV